MNDPINEKIVQQAIKSLKNNKSTWSDKVKNEFIKYGGRELTKHYPKRLTKYLIMKLYQFHGTNQIPSALIKENWQRTIRK